MTVEELINMLRDYGFEPDDEVKVYLADDTGYRIAAIGFEGTEVSFSNIAAPLLAVDVRGLKPLRWDDPIHDESIEDQEVA